MDRDTAVTMAQQAIRARNKRLVDAVLKLRAERGSDSSAERPLPERPLIAVTCSTGWECYAVCEELVQDEEVPRSRALPDAGHPGGRAARKTAGQDGGRGAGAADDPSGRRHELGRADDRGIP